MATLPTSIATAENQLGVKNQNCRFVLPLGATMNMNGTALFEGVTVLFLAQVFGVDLSIGSQIIVVILAVITAIGAAGVPGGSLPSDDAGDGLNPWVCRPTVLRSSLA